MKNFEYKKRLRSRPQGIAALIMMILLGSVAVVISLSLGLRAISENELVLHQSESLRQVFHVDGCMEEALQKLNRNASYSGETLSVEETDCVISVSGSGNERTISVNGLSTRYHRALSVTASLFPQLSVTSWQEIVN